MGDISFYLIKLEFRLEHNKMWNNLGVWIHSEAIVSSDAYEDDDEDDDESTGGDRLSI